jgi:hypothetical protein
MMFGGFSEVDGRAGCYSILISDDRGMIHRDFEKMRQLVVSLGCPDRLASVRRHNTREEAEARFAEMGIDIVTRMEMTSETETAMTISVPSSSLAPAPRTTAMTPRQRALLRAAAGPRETAGGGGGVVGDVELPNHLNLKVNCKKYPYLGIKLTTVQNTIYADVSDVLVRLEWRNVHKIKHRIIHGLVEALHTDLGKMAQAVELPNRELMETLNKRMVQWRLMGGRNGKNQIPECYERLDELKTIIDSRKLITFYHESPRRPKAS